MPVVPTAELPPQTARRFAAVLAACGVGVLLAVAFVVRVVALAASPHALGMDGANFARTAENLADGYGYVGMRGALNAVHVSLYPLLVAPALWFGASAERVAIALSVTAGTLLVLPVAAIARRLFDDRAALVAAMIVALHPYAIATSIAPLPDALATTLTVAGLALLLRSREEPRFAWGAGMLFGLALWTRSEALGAFAVTALAITLASGVRRAALLRLAALCAAFALFAVPYAAAVSVATGGTRIDAKGPVNYAIGTRIAAGMSYDEAANGLGPGGRETGAELGEGFYRTHHLAGPSIPQRFAFAVRVAPMQSLRIARHVVSRAFGTPLFALLALAGLAAAMRARRTRTDALVLVALLAYEVAAFFTLAWVWERLVAMFVAPLAIAAAGPLVTLADRFARALRSRVTVVAASSLVALASCAAAAMMHPDADAAAAALDRAAGAWIDAQAPGPKLLMAVGDEIAYAAHGDWEPLPYSSSADALAYLHAKHPAYVVLERARADARPYLPGWLARGIPDGAARRVRTYAADGRNAIVVYEWRGDGAMPVPAHADASVTDPAIAHASRVVWRAAAAPNGRLASEGTDVLTAHNDARRLGWNARERTLSVARVTPRSFGKLFELPLDGTAYAQPLVVTHVDLPRLGRHDVLVAATENDSVYAFDAHDGRRLWVHRFTACCGVSPATPQAIDPVEPCGSVRPVIGVSATPVIDRRTNTLYVVAKTMTGGPEARVFHDTLYALDLRTGEDRLAPVDVTARERFSLRGLLDGAMPLSHRVKRLLSGTLRFDPRIQYARTGLLLANGNVYVGFGSHCDVPSAHGWVFAYRAADLHRVGAFPTTRDWDASWGGGVWQSGMGITADGDGNVYFTTGNGPFDAHRGGRDFSDSLLKLSPDLGRVLDFFTPYTQAELSAWDADFGGGALLALPDAGAGTRLGVVNSKIRALFLVDRNRLGRYADGGPDRVLDRVGDEHDRTNWCVGTCGAPAYAHARGAELIYNVWALDALRVYRVDRAHARLIEVAHTRDAFPGSGGAIPSVSSDGERPGTAIVWVTTRPTISDAATKPIELRAYDAADVSHALYAGALATWPNTVGHPFLTPTIANGRVYVGTSRGLAVFGLRNER